MKRWIIGLAIAGVVLVIVMVSSCTGTSFTDTESNTSNSTSAVTPDLNTDEGDTAVTTFSVTSLTRGDWSEPNTDRGYTPLGSRAYIDMDRSGDWSDGDIALEFDGDTYYIPAAIQ